MLHQAAFDPYGRPVRPRRAQLGEFGPSWFNTPQSRVAYVAEVHRRFLSLDDDIKGYPTTDRLRREWAALFKDWQHFVETSIGPESNWVQRMANQWMPFTLVETAQRFDKQREDFAKWSEREGAKVALPKAAPLKEPIDWKTVAISAAVVTVGAWALFKGPSFAREAAKKLPKPRGSYAAGRRQPA